MLAVNFPSTLSLMVHTHTHTHTHTHPMWNYWDHAPIYLYRQRLSTSLMRGSREHLTHAGEHTPRQHTCYTANSSPPPRPPATERCELGPGSAAGRCYPCQVTAAATSLYLLTRDTTIPSLSSSQVKDIPSSISLISITQTRVRLFTRLSCEAGDNNFFKNKKTQDGLITRPKWRPIFRVPRKRISQPCSQAPRGRLAPTLKHSLGFLSSRLWVPEREEFLAPL